MVKPSVKSHHERHSSIPAPHVAELIHLLGEPVLLLPWPPGKKGAKVKWSHRTVADMQKRNYLASLSNANIGVALGEKSDGLCSIDIDHDEYVPEFDESNPALNATLRSVGSRGCNVWVRMVGAYPNAVKALKTRSGEKWGEFRSTGGQTIIYGQHPTGCRYQNNGKRVLRIEYCDIKWPASIANPPGIEPLTPGLLQCTEEPEETEEPDETDETEVLKSCVCAAPQQFFSTCRSIEDALRLSMPDAPHENNWHLFTLARAIKSLEVQQGTFSNGERLEVFSQWYQQASARKVLRPDQTEEDYMMEFVNAYRKAKYPLGSAVIARAWKRAQESEPPPEALQFKNPKTRLLVALCRELQVEAGKEPFYLSSRIAQQLLGQEHHTTAATWLGALVGLGILSIAKDGNAKSATRYHYQTAKP